MSTESFNSSSPEETRLIGAKFAASLTPGDIVLLHGSLGSGKTCLVSGISQGLGCPAETSSPTFTLINEYHGGRMPIFHVDLYRLEGRDQIEGLGLEEYFSSGGLSLVEWPERLGPLSPREAIEIYLEHRGATERHVSIHRP
jgi:tRNA threonylcarbamoyladenosine biosynthesis protein TsaE